MPNKYTLSMTNKVVEVVIVSLVPSVIHTSPLKIQLQTCVLMCL